MQHQSAQFCTRMAAVLFVAMTGFGGIRAARAQDRTTPSSTNTPAPTPVSSEDEPRPKKRHFPNRDFDRFSGQTGLFFATPANYSLSKDAWFQFGFTYRLHSPYKRSLALQPDLYCDVAFTEDSERYDPSISADAARGRFLGGIGLAERAVTSFAHRQVSAYAGLGGGLYRLETFRATSGENEHDADFEATTFRYHAGYKIFAGLSHRSGFFLEGGRLDAGRMAGLPYRGTSIGIGWRR